MILMYPELWPINRGVKDNIDDTVIFSELETLQVSENKSISGMAQSTIDKLKTIGLFDDYNLPSRNLSVLINRAD